VPQVSVAGGRSDNPAQQEGLPAAVQGALPVFNQSREVRRPHASVPRPRYSAVKVEQRALRAIPDRTGLNTAHGTARSIAIAMTVIVAMVVVFMVVGVMVMVVMVMAALALALALAFALATHLHDVVRASS